MNRVKHHTPWSGVAFAVGIAFAITVEAQGMGMGRSMGGNRPTFAEYDLNGDGRLIEQEFNQARANRLSARAQQGYQMRNAGQAPAFTTLDRNGDGTVNAAEFAAHQAQRFSGR